MPVFNNMLAGASGGAGAGGYEIKRSLRFNKGDSAHLDRTPSSQGNRRKFTWSGWVKRNEVGNSESALFSAGNNPWFDINFRNDKLTVVTDAGISGTGAKTEAVYRDVSAWYHVVCVVNTEESTANDRIKLWVNGVRQTTTDNGYGYPAQNLNTIVNTTIAHRIGADGRVSGGGVRHANIQLADVHFIDGQTPGTTTDDSNGSVTGTPNAEYLTDFGEFDDNGVWQPIKYAGTYGTNGFHLPFTDNSSNAALGTDTSGNSNTWTVNNLTAASNPNYTSNLVFTGGNYGGGHSADKAFDGNINTSALTANQGTDQYVTFTPGAAIPYSTSVEFTATTTDQLVSLNGGTEIVCTAGAWTTLASGSGTITEIKARANSSSFGRIAAIRVDGTILIAGDPPSSDSLRDSPSQIAGQTDSGAGGEVVGNYATLNPLDSPVSNSGSLTNGNLNLNGAVAWSGNRATIAYPSSGKWYYETQVNGSATSRNSNSQYSVVGLCKTSDSFTGSDSTNNILWLGDNGYGRNFSSSGTTDIFGANIDQGKIIGLAVNMDNNTFEYFVDGVSKQTGTINVTSGTSLSPYMASYGNSQTSLIANFGQRAFAYTAPSGYKALCTANLPEPTIADGSKYFDTKLYTGDGSNPRSITGVGHSSDFVWIKARNAAAGHVLQDVVRGPGNNVLASHTTGAEGSETYGQINSFDSDGFTVTNGASGDQNINQNNRTYAAWSWDAGDDANPTTIAAGSLNSSAYNQSQNWTNLISFNSGGWNGNGTNPFDADAANSDYGNTTRANGGYATLNISSLTGSRVISVTSQQTEVTITHDGGTTTFTPPHTSQITHTFDAVTNPTSIKFEGLNGNSVFVLVGVSVDGARLINSGISLPNVPSIASTVRANPSAGFSIVNYTGTGSGITIGHDLNVAPALYIQKDRDATDSWRVYTTVIDGSLDYLNFEYPGAKNNSSYAAPTSTVLNIGGLDGDDHIVYCFAPVAGYSAMGSYTGNGSDDGPFIYTGFKARWIMIKSYYASNSGSHNHWSIYDTARDTGNEAQTLLLASVPDSEFTNGSGYTEIDILSNGFKLKADSGGYSNYNTNQYIYLAFAEHPFKTARAR